MTQTYELSNGVKIPCIGFGTWQTPDGNIAIDSVKEAIKVGYTHIDTAAIYANEKSIGKALKQCGVDRSKLFITSKVWNTKRGYETTIKAFETSLSDLGLEYLDLYLIHWPASKTQFQNWEEINLQTWQAMIELYKAGKIKAIGVSNFLPHHLEALMKTQIKPMVNQIEIHPGYKQSSAVKFCKDNGILIEAWSPLGTGQLLNNPILAKLADKYQKSVAQICIRWSLQHGFLPLPKSITPARILQNTQVFDFSLLDVDMKIIDDIEFCGGQALHPDEVDF